MGKNTKKAISEKLNLILKANSDVETDNILIEGKVEKL